MRVTDKLKNKIKESLQEEEYSISKNCENIFKSSLNFDSLKSLVQDDMLIEFLKEQSFKLFKTQAQNALDLGKILNTVYDKLSKQGSSNGIYEKWLAINGINKRTALRYRRRYELYLLVNNKEYIAIMPQKYIDMFFSEENKIEYISIINSSGTYEEAINLLKDKTIVPEKIEYTNIVDFDFRNCNTLFIDIEKKIENLKEKEKKELQKHLIKIQEILN